MLLEGVGGRKKSLCITGNGEYAAMESCVTQPQENSACCESQGGTLTPPIFPTRFPVAPSLVSPSFIPTNFYLINLLFTKLKH